MIKTILIINEICRNFCNKVHKYSKTRYFFVCQHILILNLIIIVLLKININSMVLGGRDTRNDRQDTGERRRSKEEAQCHPISAAIR